LYAGTNQANRSRQQPDLGSLFEQSLRGHEIKTCAFVSHVTYNQLRGSQDAYNYYVDTEEVDRLP